MHNMSLQAQRGNILVTLLLLIVAGVGVLFWIWQDYQRFQQTPLTISGDDLIYSIEPGTSFAALTKDLTDKGVLRQPHYLHLLARQLGVAGKIKAGEYAIKPGTTPLELLDQFVRGRVIEYSLTIIEGWNFRQMLNAVRSHPMLVQTLAESLSTEQIMQALGYGGEHPEGRFYPDTYLFPRGTTDVQFLRRAYQTMEKVLDEEWQTRADNLPIKTPYEALILASIVEKETGIPEERGEVAGVFTRRLQNGMLLQTDPTVIYGMGDDYTGVILRSDLQRDMSYNTYTRSGLPPTPIALPGRASIHAALNPDDGDTLYFVASGDGGHVFSRTLEEHNRAVQRYRAQLRRSPSQ